MIKAGSVYNTIIDDKHVVVVLEETQFGHMVAQGFIDKDFLMCAMGDLYIGNVGESRVICEPWNNYLITEYVFGEELFQLSDEKIRLIVEFSAMDVRGYNYPNGDLIFLPINENDDVKYGFRATEVEFGYCLFQRCGILESVR